MNRPVRRWRVRLATLVTGGALIAALFPMAGTRARGSAARAQSRTPDLAAGSDTGNSNADNVTKTLGRPRSFTGTAEAGSTVQDHRRRGRPRSAAPSADRRRSAYSGTTGVRDPRQRCQPHHGDGDAMVDGTGPASAALTVTTDNIAPGAPSVPDLDRGERHRDVERRQLHRRHDAHRSPARPMPTPLSSSSPTPVSVGTATASGTPWTITSSARRIWRARVHRGRQTDAAGNGPSAASGPLSVTIDTAVPARADRARPRRRERHAARRARTTSRRTRRPPSRASPRPAARSSSSRGRRRRGRPSRTGAASGRSPRAPRSPRAHTRSPPRLRTWRARASPRSALPVTILTALGVTINQATGAGRSDRHDADQLHRRLHEPSCRTSSARDVTITGTAGGTLAPSVTGGGTTYNVAVTGMTDAGTVIASIAAGKATDLAGNVNAVATFTDHDVTWDPVAGPAVTINQAAGQADPTGDVADQLHGGLRRCRDRLRRDRRDPDGHRGRDDRRRDRASARPRTPLPFPA